MSEAPRRILLARHAQTVANERGALLGHHDSPLTAAGEAQVRWLAREVAPYAPRTVYCSPLGRAGRTARAVSSEPVTVLDRLREIGFGEAEGLTWAEAGARGLILDVTGGGPVAAGGERLDGFARRVEDAALTIERGDFPALVVTHGGVARLLLGRWLGLREADAWRIELPNGALAVVRLEEGPGVLERLVAPPAG